MGNSTSNTRRITVVNDDASGVIKISDSVVNRLRGELESQSNKVRKPEPQPEFFPSVRPPSPVHRDENRPIAPPPPKPVLPSKSLPSTQVEKAEKIPHHHTGKEDGRGEGYWREKYNESEAGLDELHKNTVKEFNKSLDEVEALFGHHTNTCYLACEELENKIVKCYQENVGKTLNCSHTVREFANCVDAMRAKTFAAKG